MHFDIRRLETTASTNDDVKRAADEGHPQGLVVWALSQSAGRGRQGRQWQSPIGNLYCSVLLRPQGLQRDYGRYSFIAALAIRDAIHERLPEGALKLKWPNDVLVYGKKISGILLEAGDGWLVIGMGVNVQHKPENPLYPVTDLATEKADIAVEVLLHKVLKALDYWYERFVSDGFEPIRQAWLDSARRGPMRVRVAEGDIEGLFVDLDVDGNLRLRMADGTARSISTGDVFF